MRVATFKRLNEEQVLGWRVEIETVQGGTRNVIHKVNSAGRSYPKDTTPGWHRWQPHVVRLVAPIEEATLAFANQSGGMQVLLLVISTGIRYWVSSDTIVETGEVLLEIPLNEDSIGDDLIIIPSFRSTGVAGSRSALDLWAPGKIVVDFVGQQSWFPVESRKFATEGEFINVELPDPSECTLSDDECPLYRTLSESVRIQIDMESEEWLRLQASLNENPPTNASHHALARIFGFVVVALRSWEVDLESQVLDQLIGSEPSLPSDSFGWFVRSLHHRLDPEGLYKSEDVVFWLQLVGRLTGPRNGESTKA
jgi:hypothetical protein